MENNTPLQPSNPVTTTSQINYQPVHQQNSSLPIILGGVALLILGLGMGSGYYIGINQAKAPAAEKIVAEPSTPPSFQEEVTPSPVSNAGDTYVTFKDAGGHYQFSYPEADLGYILQQFPSSILVSKYGSTQKLNTGLSDGVALSFKHGELLGKTLSEIVDEDLAACADCKPIEDKKAVTINGNTGFTYVTTMQSTTRKYLLQNNQSSTSYLRVEIFVADPNNAGYQAEAEKIVNSIKVLK